MRSSAILIGFALCVSGGPAPPPEAAEDRPALAAGNDAITAWARERHGDRLVEPVSAGFGDFTGGRGDGRDRLRPLS